jgi:hypothetical protein
MRTPVLALHRPAALAGRGRVVCLAALLAVACSTAPVCPLAQQYEYAQPWLSGIQWGPVHLQLSGPGPLRRTSRMA